MGGGSEASLWSIYGKPLLFVNGANLVLAAVAYALSLGFVGPFEVLLMLEGAGLLIFGGMLDFASSMFGTQVGRLLLKDKRDYTSQHHRGQQRRASRLILMGIAMLAEAIVLSLLLV